MSKKTLFLIFVLAILTGFLLWIAISLENPVSVIKTTFFLSPSPILPPLTTLRLSRDSMASRSAHRAFDVVIDTNGNSVMNVQLELGYDPLALTNISIKPGSFFVNPIENVKNLDSKNGRVSYVLGIQGNDERKAIKGTGIVATIHYDIMSTATDSATYIYLLPKTQVTASGIEGSAVKNMEAGLFIPLY